VTLIEERGHAHAVFRGGELAGLVTVVEQPGGSIVSESRSCG
jgi:hypothetical protein